MAASGGGESGLERWEVVEVSGEHLLQLYMPSGFTSKDVDLSFSTTSKGIAVHVDSVRDNAPLGRVELEGYSLPEQVEAKYKKADRRFAIKLVKMASKTEHAEVENEDAFHDAQSDLDIDGADAVPQLGKAAQPAVSTGKVDGTAAAAAETAEAGAAGEDDEGDGDGEGEGDVDPEVRKALKKARKKEREAARKAAKRAAAEAEVEQPQGQRQEQHAASTQASAAAEPAAAAAAAGEGKKKKKKKKKGGAAAAKGDEQDDEQEEGEEPDTTVGGAEVTAQQGSEKTSVAAVAESNGSPAAGCDTSPRLEQPSTPPRSAQAAVVPSSPRTPGGSSGNKAIKVDVDNDFAPEPHASSVLNIAEAPKPSSLLTGPHMRYSFAKSDYKGEDKALQAPHNTWTLPSVEGTTAFSAFGVFDGHGGKSAPTYVAKNLLPLVTSYVDRCKGPDPKVPEAPPASEEGAEVTEEERRVWAAQEALIEKLPKAMVAAFLEVNETCMRRCKTSGTTATLAVSVGWELVVASVGDSLAYLDTGSEIIQVSGNHRVGESPEEVDRVVAAGGHIAQSDIDGVVAGPMRVWPGGLMMSRSLGDASAGGLVLAEPEVRQITLPVGGARLFVASDGLWDAVQYKSFISSVRKQPAGVVVNMAVHAAIKKKGLCDDISVVVVDFCASADDKVPPALEAAAGGGKRRGALSADQSTQIVRPLDAPSATWREAIAQRRAAVAAAQLEASTLAAAAAAEQQQQQAQAPPLAPAPAASPRAAPAATSTQPAAAPQMSDAYLELAQLKIDVGSLSLETDDGVEDDGWQTVGGQSKGDGKALGYMKELQAAAVAEEGAGAEGGAQGRRQGRGRGRGRRGEGRDAGHGHGRGEGQQGGRGRGRPYQGRGYQQEGAEQSPQQLQHAEPAGAGEAGAAAVQEEGVVGPGGEVGSLQGGGRGGRNLRGSNRGRRGRGDRGSYPGQEGGRGEAPLVSEGPFVAAVAADQEGSGQAGVTEQQQVQHQRPPRRPRPSPQSAGSDPLAAAGLGGGMAGAEQQQGAPRQDRGPRGGRGAARSQGPARAASTGTDMQPTSADLPAAAAPAPRFLLVPRSQLQGSGPGVSNNGGQAPAGYTSGRGSHGGNGGFSEGQYQGQGGREGQYQGGRGSGAPRRQNRGPAHGHPSSGSYPPPGTAPHVPDIVPASEFGAGFGGGFGAAPVAVPDAQPAYGAEPGRGSRRGGPGGRGGGRGHGRSSAGNSFTQSAEPLAA